LAFAIFKNKVNFSSTTFNSLILSITVSFGLSA